MPKAGGFVAQGCSFAQLAGKSARTSVFFWIIDLEEGMTSMYLPRRNRKKHITNVFPLLMPCLANLPAM